MGISVMANLMMCASVLSQPKKRHNMVYWLLMLLFGLNVVDYGLLIFEFTLGIEHEYPHGRDACAVYQTVSKGNPVIQAAVVIILAYYAANHYSSVSSPGCSNHQNGLKMALVISGLSVLFGLWLYPRQILQTLSSPKGNDTAKFPFQRQIRKKRRSIS